LQETSLLLFCKSFRLFVVATNANIYLLSASITLPSSVAFDDVSDMSLRYICSDYIGCVNFLEMQSDKSVMVTEKHKPNQDYVENKQL